jgi:hypothetical protein
LKFAVILVSKSITHAPVSGSSICRFTQQFHCHWNFGLAGVSVADPCPSCYLINTLLDGNIDRQTVYMLSALYSSHPADAVYLIRLTVSLNIAYLHANQEAVKVT